MYISMNQCKGNQYNTSNVRNIDICQYLLICSGYDCFIIMKRGTDKIRPHQQIKIPIEFARRMDRISANELHQIDLLQKKDVDFTNQYMSTKLPRKYTSLEIHQKSRQPTKVAFKSKQMENSSRQPSVRFRTTGAGFRQRVLPKNEEPNNSKKNIIFRRSPSKIIKAPSLNSHTKIDKIILQKTSIEIKKPVKTQKKGTRDLKPRKIYFGQKYQFNQKAQYQYNEQISEQDLQWQHQSLSYHNRGFGIDNDLSRFDLQSLDDLDGRLFISRYKQMKGFCPLFVDGKYQWMEVEVKDFDQKTQSVIVHRVVLDDLRKISRLSIKFQTSSQEATIYWRRINQAKRLRKNIREQEKYTRYVKSRKEQFNIEEVLQNPIQKFKNIIQKQWLNVYSRQCIIYKEMVLKPDKFEQMGIKIRKYTQFKQPPIVPPFQSFTVNQAAIKVKHYTRIDKFPQTLRKLFERLSVQACKATCTAFPLMYIEQLLNLQMTTVKQAVQKVKKDIRELLLSDILGGLAFSFKNKTEQLHYLKLHNFIYKDLIIENFYYANCKNWVQFLSYFISFNLKTPRPIVKLTIFINSQLKKIDLNPCVQKVVNSLLQPLILIQKGTKSIPDIMSQVIGGQNLIKVNNSIVQNSKQTIQKIVECSYKYIREYCNSLSSKLVHLERTRLIKLPFTKDGLKRYQSMLQLIKQDWYQVTHSIIQQPPLFMVDTSPLQSTLCDSIEKQKTRLGKLIQKQIQEEMAKKIDQFQQRSDYLKQVPRDYLQVINMRKYLNVDCEQFMDASIAHQKLTQQFFNLLEAHCYQYSQATFEKATQIIFVHNDFMKTIRAKFNQLNEIQQAMIEQINNQRDKIMKELEQMQPQIEIIKGYASLVNFSESYVSTSRNYYSLQKLKKDLQQMNYREKLLGQQISIFPILGKLEKEIHPYFDLWNITYQLMAYINTLKTDPICTIKYEDLNQKLAEYYKDLHRLVNYFVNCKNAQAFNICQSLIQSVKNSQSKMWIVRSFTLEGVSKKEAIRNIILDTIFKGKQVKFQELTLQDLLDQNIQQHEQFVIENSEKADRIWKLQLRLAGIVKELHSLQFQFQYQYTLPFVNEKLLLSLICSIHEQIEIMDQIKDLDEAQYIQKKINAIYNKLVVIEQTLKQISHFQIYFIPIFRLTRIEEISQEMPKEISTLGQVQRIWKTMCNHFIKQNQIWEAIETDSYKNRLENLFKLMNQVNKKLDQVIDLKRQQFPRLFFISQTYFKSLLLNEEELALSRNMTILFSGIKNIIIQGDKIKGVIGTRQQQILFKRSLPKTNVWENLKSIVQEIEKIIAWEINFTLNKKQKYTFSKTIKLLCDWTFQIQEAIGSRSLDQLLTKIVTSINQLSSNCCFENYYTCTFLLAQRDKVYQLKTLNIYELSNFQWRKQIRYYKTEQGTAQVKSLNLHLPFHRQFTGHEVRPIILLSDKSTLQIIVCAWTMNNGLFLQGTGCETIEQLSKLTLRHFVNIKIGSQSNEQQITSFMKGYLLSNCWSCFSLTSALAQGIFNIIAQTAFQIHSVVQAGNTLFYLGAEDYNLSKSFKFNLTINNMIQKNEELQNLESISTIYQKNHKFGIVFRSVGLLLPSESCIIKFKLEALGITPEVIKSLLQCYEIYLLKISDQWYYKDFSQAIENFSNQYLQNQNKDGLNTIQLFYNIWTPQLKPAALQKIGQFLKNYNKRGIQQKILTQMIDDIDSNINKQKRQILVVGSHLSGKMSLIINIFKAANKQIKHNLQYQSGSFDHWQLLDIQFYNNLIPIEQKLVVKARQTSHMSPQDVNKFFIYYHINPVKWNLVLVHEFKATHISESLKRQVLRQIGVLFNLPIVTQTSNSIKIALTLSFLKLLIIFVNRVKMQTLTLIQMTEIVFFLIFWQNIAFFPGLYLKPNIFGSVLQRQAINYYFDTQKMAWLQWVTLQGMDFNSTAAQLSKLHIPIKETVSVTYFMKLTANFNVWISSESLGIGTHKIIKRSIKKGILQMQKVHIGDSAQKMSKIINLNAGIYKKDGKFYPKLNQILTVCIEDVNLPSNAIFDNYLSILCNHEYETLLKRKIANVYFIFTAHSKQQNQKNIGLLMAKSIIRIGALDPCQQSRQTLFKHYLDWFFSNTQNPFSKQVRNTAQFLIDISIYLTNKINKIQRKKCTLAHVVKVFEGISTCSPRTIKSSLEIMQLWYFEWNSVFHDKEFKGQGRSNYNEEIQLFVKELGPKFEANIHQNVDNILKSQKIVFIKHSPLKIQYSQTYRKVDILFIHQYLQNLLNQSNLSNHSFFPFIIYPQFLNMVCRIMRVLNIPKRHLLLYGEIGSGKKTLLRIASMVCWGYDAPIITNDTNWKLQVIKNLKQLVKNRKQLCLIFKLEGENHELIQLAQELIHQCHPRAFLFDENLKYLQSIGIGSPDSKQYNQFKQNIETCVHHCITVNLKNLDMLKVKYPAIIRRLQRIDVMERYMRGQLIQIAKVSVEAFYQKFTNFGQLNSILSQFNIHLSKSSFIRFMQLTVHYHSKSITQIKLQENMIDDAILKIRITQKQKKQLEAKLLDLKTKLHKMGAKVQQMKLQYNVLQEEHVSKENLYKEHYEQCQINKYKTNQIRVEVQNQLNKVFPMLNAAEEAMAKVTRDDINQLRSFPNPPLPAAKVVQSLIFLFNESQLVKEKVLEGGQKVRDFWEYAKKFILNDKLLKRVSEFKPDFIRNINSSIIATLKNIIQKPQFIQERVFKASVAAGNLSLWVRAILAVHQVMNLMEPKKKILSEAEQALRTRQGYLKAELESFNQFTTELLQNKAKLDLKIEEMYSMQRQIKRLEQTIEQGTSLLQLLHIKQKDWNFMKEKQLQQRKFKSRMDAIFTAIRLFIIDGLQEQKKHSVLTKIYQLFDIKHQKDSNVINNLSLGQYPQKIYETWKQLKTNGTLFPLTQNFLQSIILFHESLNFNEQMIIVIDKTDLLIPYICNMKASAHSVMQFKTIDCLSMKDIDNILAQFIEDQNEDSQTDEVNKSNSIHKNVLAIYNLEHRPQFLGSIDILMKQLSKYQIVLIVNEQTPQWLTICAQHNLAIATRIQISPKMYIWFVQQIFQLHIPQIQSLSKTIAQKRIKLDLLNIIKQQHNIIEHQSIMKQWTSTYLQQCQIKKQTIAHTKTITKLQKQTFQEISNIINNRTNLQTFVSYIKEYISSQSEGTATIWNLPKFLAAQLEIPPSSMVKVLQVQNSSTNPLAYLLLKFGNIQQLEQPKITDKFKAIPKQAQNNQILNLRCQIVNPVLVLNILKKNIPAYLPILNKYALLKGLEQCKTIEKMKMQACQEDAKQQLLEEGYNIYLLPQGGILPCKQLSILKEDVAKQIITHKQFEPVRQQYIEAYQMERLHRKFSLLPKADREYFQKQLHHCKIYKMIPSRLLYLQIQEMKERQQSLKLVVTKVEASNIFDQYCFEFGGNAYRLVLERTGQQLPIWQIENELFKMHYRSC